MAYLVPPTYKLISLRFQARGFGFGIRRLGWDKTMYAWVIWMGGVGVGDWGLMGGRKGGGWAGRGKRER